MIDVDKTMIVIGILDFSLHYNNSGINAIRVSLFRFRIAQRIGLGKGLTTIFLGSTTKTDLCEKRNCCGKSK